MYVCILILDQKTMQPASSTSDPTEAGLGRNYLGSLGSGRKMEGQEPCKSQKISIVEWKYIIKIPPFLLPLKTVHCPNAS